MRPGKAARDALAVASSPGPSPASSYFVVDDVDIVVAVLPAAGSTLVFTSVVVLATAGASAFAVVWVVVA